MIPKSKPPSSVKEKGANQNDPPNKAIDTTTKMIGWDCCGLLLPFISTSTTKDTTGKPTASKETDTDTSDVGSLKEEKIIDALDFLLDEGEEVVSLPEQVLIGPSPEEEEAMALPEEAEALERARKKDERKLQKLEKLERKLERLERRKRREEEKQEATTTPPKEEWKLVPLVESWLGLKAEEPAETKETGLFLCPIAEGADHTTTQHAAENKEGDATTTTTPGWSLGALAETWLGQNKPVEEEQESTTQVESTTEAAEERPEEEPQELDPDTQKALEAVLEGLEGVEREKKLTKMEKKLKRMERKKRRQEEEQVQQTLEEAMERMEEENQKVEKERVEQALKMEKEIEMKRWEELELKRREKQLEEENQRLDMERAQALKKEKEAERRRLERKRKKKQQEEKKEERRQFIRKQKEKKREAERLRAERKKKEMAAEMEEQKKKDKQREAEKQRMRVESTTLEQKEWKPTRNSRSVVLYSFVARDGTIVADSFAERIEANQCELLEELGKDLAELNPMPGWFKTTFLRQSRKLRGIKFNIDDINAEGDPVGWDFGCIYDPRSELERVQVKSFIEKIVGITEVFRQEDYDWQYGPYLAAQSTFGPILSQRMEEISYMGKRAMLSEKIGQVSTSVTYS